MGFWEELLHYLPAIVGAIATVIVTVVGVRGRSKGTNIESSLNKVISMLPSLINLTELTNASKTGEEKKAFLMEYINGLLSIMGASVDDHTSAYISSHIDNIITLTKQMHTKEEEVNIEKDF